jgi:hypothetical protein
MVSNGGRAKLNILSAGGHFSETEQYILLQTE